MATRFRRVLVLVTVWKQPWQPPPFSRTVPLINTVATSRCITNDNITLNSTHLGIEIPLPPFADPACLGLC